MRPSRPLISPRENSPDANYGYTQTPPRTPPLSGREQTVPIQAGVTCSLRGNGVEGRLSGREGPGVVYYTPRGDGVEGRLPVPGIDVPRVTHHAEVKSVRVAQPVTPPRSAPATPPAPCLVHTEPAAPKIDARVDDLVRAVIILRDEVAHLRDNNSSEFTIHANAIASLRGEIGQKEKEKPVREIVIAEVTERCKVIRHDLMASISEVREYVDDVTKANSLERVEQRVRELQETVETRWEEVESVMERVEELENKSDGEVAEVPMGGYVTHNGKRLSTVTELVDECKTRVLDDVVSGIRGDVTDLHERITALEEYETPDYDEPLAELQESITSLRAECKKGDTRQEIARLKEQLEELDLESVQADVNSLARDLKVLKKDGANLNQVVEALQEQVETPQDSSDIEQLSRDLVKIAGENSANVKKIAELEESVRSLMENSSFDRRLREIEERPCKDESYLQGAVENSRLAVTELSQNLSGLSCRVESLSKITTRVAHIEEELKSFSMIKPQQQGCEQSCACPSCNPRIKESPVLYHVAQTLCRGKAAEVPAVVHPQEMRNRRYPPEQGKNNPAYTYMTSQNRALCRATSHSPRGNNEASCVVCRSLSHSPPQHGSRVEDKRIETPPYQGRGRLVCRFPPPSFGN